MTGRAMACVVKVVLGSIALAVFGILAVFPAVPFLPTGRTAGSLLGAMLMVVFRVLTPDQAYAAIDLPILGLLFGTMVAKNWQKALELYEDLKSAKIEQTVSTVNALITALCVGDQLQKAMEVLSEMKSIGLRPDGITYSILVVSSEKKDDLEAGLMLLSQAEMDKVVPKLVMCRCIIGD